MSKAVMSLDIFRQRHVATTNVVNNPNILKTDNINQLNKMNHFVIPFIYKIEKMNRMNKMNYIVPHLYSEKDKMNKMNHFPPPLL